MSTIAETVERTLGFHGKGMTDVMQSVVDALEQREAQIQADLLRFSEAAGLDEDAVLAHLHHIFQHRGGDTPTPSLDVRMGSLLMAVRNLSEQASALSDFLLVETLKEN